ncbi:hypothetical protein HMPREF1347_01746 [Enterococcus faecium 504]|nr:hypothetical protein HMPREF1347_01746 [Enterococcus faecium 504]
MIMGAKTNKSCPHTFFNWLAHLIKWSDSDGLWLTKVTEIFTISINKKG